MPTLHTKPYLIMNKEFNPKTQVMHHLGEMFKCLYNPNQEQAEFVFNEKDHSYYWGNRPMTGVTTIVGVLPKYALAAWQAKQERAAMHYGYALMHEDNQTAIDVLQNKKWGYDLCDDTKTKVENVIAGRTRHRGTPIENLITVAKGASKDYLNYSAEFGKQQHTKVEDYNNMCINENAGAPIDFDDLNEEQKTRWQSIKQYINWAVFGSNEHSGVSKFIGSEEKVYSLTYFYAGTYDILFRDNKNNLCMGDFKTSSGIWDSYYAQMGGYQIARQEMIHRGLMDGEKVDCRMVIRLGRKHDDFEIGFSDKGRKDVSMFLSALHTYRMLNNK